MLRRQLRPGWLLTVIRLNDAGQRLPSTEGMRQRTADLRASPQILSLHESTRRCLSPGLRRLASDIKVVSTERIPRGIVVRPAHALKSIIEDDQSSG